MDATDGTRMKAMLRGWLAAHAPPDPGPAFVPTPCPVGTVDDLPGAPGPQPPNGGITPGYRPPRDGPEAVTVEELRAALAGCGSAAEVRRLFAMVKKGAADLGEAGAWIREVEDGVELLRLRADEAERGHGIQRDDAGESSTEGGGERQADGLCESG